MRKVFGNYNEVCFIVFNMIIIFIDVLMFFFFYYGIKMYYKDIFVSVFLIVVDIVMIMCMFLLKVYVIVFCFQKNVDFRLIVSLGVFDIDDDEG